MKGNLVLLLDQSHGLGSTQTWPDLSRNGNDIEQTTVDNQPSIGTGPPARREFTTNDNMPQKVYDDETGATSYRISAKANNAFAWIPGVDLSPFATSTDGDDSVYELIMTDSSGNRAKGYIRAIGSGEAINNLWTSDFSAGVDGTSAVNGTVAGNIDGIGGQDDNHRFTVDGANDQHLWSKGGLFSEGALNRIRNTYYIPSTNSHLDSILLRIGASDAINVLMNTTDAWTSVDTYHTAKTAATSLFVYAADGGTVVFQDAGADDVFYSRGYIIDEITECPATGVHLYDSISGGNQSLAYKHASFDPNDISTIEVRKAAFSITSDFAIGIAIKPDDGRPATDEVVWTKGEYTTPLYGFSLKLLTTGKLECVVSSDGSTKTGKVTDSAVFADGAASDYKIIFVVYDASEQSIVFYVDGSVEASSNLAGGGPPTSIYDVPLQFLVGSGSDDSDFYNGDIAKMFFFNTTISAAQASTITTEAAKGL